MYIDRSQEAHLLILSLWYFTKLPNKPRVGVHGNVQQCRNRAMCSLISSPNLKHHGQIPTSKSSPEPYSCHCAPATDFHSCHCSTVIISLAQVSNLALYANVHEERQARKKLQPITLELRSCVAICPCHAGLPNQRSLYLVDAPSNAHRSLAINATCV